MVWYALIRHGCLKWAIDKRSPLLCLTQDMNGYGGSQYTQEACSESLRLTIVPPATPGADYTFQPAAGGVGVTSGWVQERMGSPRVMPDVVVLPNGCIIILNGAHYGYGGGYPTVAFSPNFFAEM